jgi:hypothetical protein
MIAGVAGFNTIAFQLSSTGLKKNLTLHPAPTQIQLSNKEKK